jgi:hypothetical protein
VGREVKGRQRRGEERRGGKGREERGVFVREGFQKHFPSKYLSIFFWQLFSNCKSPHMGS